MRTNLFPNFTPPLGRRALITKNSLTCLSNMPIQALFGLCKTLLAFI